ncbi:MAG: hypothetical protein ABJ308_13175 [Halieaceae bacterium]
MTLQIRKKVALNERVMQEPLTSATELKRRNLIYISSIAILLTVYDLKIKNAPWIDIEVPEGDVNVLLGAVSVALIYVFMVFVFYVIADLRRWYQAGELIRLGSYWDMLQEMSRHNTMVSTHTITPPESRETENLQNAARGYFDEATKFGSEIEQKIKDVVSQQNVLSNIQCLRLLSIDVGIPLALGAFGISKTYMATIPFLSAIFE